MSFTAYSKPQEVRASDGAPVIPCRVLVRDSVWCVPPKERPAGWRQDERYRDVREPGKGKHG